MNSPQPMSNLLGNAGLAGRQALNTAADGIPEHSSGSSEQE